MKKDVFTALEITDSYIKLLQGKPGRSKISVSLCVVEKLSDPGEERLAAVLKKVLAFPDVESDQYTLIVPRRLALLKQMMFPSHKPEEVKNMASLQAVNLVPFSRDDTIVDCVILENESTGYSKALAMVLQKEVVTRYLRLLTQTGKTPQKITLSSCGIFQWYQSQKWIFKTVKPGGVVLVNIDAHNSEICFCDQNNLLFSRHLNVGVEDIAQNNTEPLLEQIGLTFGAYKKEKLGGTITSIVVITPTMVLFDLKDKLQSYYQLPVNIYRPADQLTVDKYVGASPNEENTSVSLTSALGVILGQGQLPVDLMPKDVVSTRRTLLWKKKLVNFFVLLSATVALGLIAAWANVYKKTHYLKTVEQRLGQMEGEADKAEKKISQLLAVQEEIESRVIIPDIMRELIRLAPSDVSFRNIQLLPGRELILEGNAEKGTSVNIFQGKLVGSAFFQDVNLQYATKRKRMQMEYTEFKITCRLLNNRDKDHE